MPDTIQWTAHVAMSETPASQYTLLFLLANPAFYLEDWVSSREMETCLHLMTSPAPTGSLIWIHADTGVVWIRLLDEETSRYVVLPVEGVRAAPGFDLEADRLRLTTFDEYIETDDQIACILGNYRILGSLAAEALMGYLRSIQQADTEE